MTKKRYKIEAICYDARGRIISRAFNSYSKTHPIQSHFANQVGEPSRIYLHAEILALLRAGSTPVDTIQVINHNGGSAKPCNICQAALNAWRVNHMVLQSQGSRS